MNTYCPNDLGRRDPELIARILPRLQGFNASYFRLEVEGSEHAQGGPAMFVANHNGGILGPDVLCTLSVLWKLLTPQSPLYALAHDFPMRQLRPLGRALQRIGAVSASRRNALRVLGSGGQVLVYPGGDLDAYRHSRRRNEVVLLPRTGFVAIARRLGAPIIPIVARGAHRSAYIFSEGRRLARLLGMRRWARLEMFPLALALPWGLAPGPWLPYLPLPFPVRLRLLRPLRAGPEETNLSVARRVQDVMQEALTAMAA